MSTDTIARWEAAKKAEAKADRIYRRIRSEGSVEAIKAARRNLTIKAQITEEYRRAVAREQAEIVASTAVRNVNGSTSLAAALADRKL